MRNCEHVNKTASQTLDGKPPTQLAAHHELEYECRVPFNKHLLYEASIYDNVQSFQP